MDPEKKSLYTAKRPSGLNTTDIDLQPVVARLKNDEGDINWLLLTVNSTSNVLELSSSGNSGIDELKANLNDETIFYGVFKCAIAGKSKFFHLYFVGPNVPAMKKGKGSLNKNAIFQLIDAHGEIVCPAEGVESFSREFVVSDVARVTRSSPDLIVMP